MKIADGMIPRMMKMETLMKITFKSKGEYGQYQPIKYHFQMGIYY